MHGSAKALARKEQFMAEIARTPAFRLDDIHDLSKDEVRERTMEKFSTMVSPCSTFDRALAGSDVTPRPAARRSTLTSPDLFRGQVHYVTTESLETFALRMQLIGIADPAFWTRFGGTSSCWPEVSLADLNAVPLLGCHSPLRPLPWRA
jgi:acyl-CoA oxidase